MWGKNEPEAPSPSPQAPPKPAPVASKPAPPQPVPSVPTSSPPVAPLSSPPAGHLTRLLVVKGEVAGTDDLFVDGEAYGKVRLEGAKLTIGPDGRVQADVEAREVVVRGELKGTIKAIDRVQIAATARVFGQIITRLISIEEGAELHVRVNLDREERPRAGAVMELDNRSLNHLTGELSRVNV